MKRLRYTKKEAAAKLGISDSTIDRRISDGTLNVEREYHGKTHRVWVVLEDDGVTDGVDASIPDEVDAVDEVLDAPPDESASSESSTELAVLREQLRNAQELADYRGNLLVEADARAQMLIGLLRQTQEANTNLTAALALSQQENADIVRALPPAMPERFPGERRRGLLGWLRRH